MFLSELLYGPSKPIAEGIDALEQKLPKELRERVLDVDEKGWNAPGQAAAYYRTASSFKFVGKYERANLFYQRVLHLDPNHWKAKYNIASCHLYQGHIEEAERLFVALVEDLRALDWQSERFLASLLRGAYMQLNTICQEKHLYNRGTEYLMQSLEVSPDDAVAYANLAISDYYADKYEEARKWYQILMDHPEKLQALCKMQEHERQHLESIVGA